MPLPKLRKPHTKSRCRAHVSDTISTLMHEGRPQAQAVAIALSHARRQGCHIEDTRGRSGGGFSGFDLFDDVADDAPARRHADELLRELGPRYSHPADRLLGPKVLPLLRSPLLFHHITTRTWVVEVKDDVDPLAAAPKLHRALVGKRSLTSADPFLHDMKLYVVGATSIAVFDPATKSVEGRAAGKAPRPPKGTPTDLNLFTLYKELERHHGLEAALGKGPRALGPLFAFEATSMAAMRKLVAAGYLAPALDGKKGHWELTAMGQTALARWRADHAGRMGIPADEKHPSDEPTLLELAWKAPEYPIGPANDSPPGDWRYAVPVPLAMLSHVPARSSRNIARRMSGEERLESLRKLRRLPPIELAVAPDGKVRLMDGNHRLLVARERGDQTIDVAFMFVNKSDDRYVGRASGRVQNARYGLLPPRYEATSKPALARIDRGAFLEPRGPGRFRLVDDSCEAHRRFEARHGMTPGTLCAEDGLGRASGRRPRD